VGALEHHLQPGRAVEFSGQVPFEGIDQELENGARETRKMRSVSVPRDYSMPLLVTKPTPNSCAHVVNGLRLELPPEEESRTRSIAPYSRIELILTEATPAQPPRGCLAGNQITSGAITTRKSTWRAKMRIGISL